MCLFRKLKQVYCWLLHRNIRFRDSQPTADEAMIKKFWADDGGECGEEWQKRQCDHCKNQFWFLKSGWHNLPKKSNSD